MEFIYCIESGIIDILLLFDQFKKNKQDSVFGITSIFLHICNSLSVNIPFEVHNLHILYIIS